MKRATASACVFLACAVPAFAQTMTAPASGRTVSSSTLPATKPPTVVDDTAIRPFTVRIPQVQLVDLKRRIDATRWPDKETVADESQGVPLATLQELAHYWATDYDWRRLEAKLNSYPQFVTNIDGLDIHFIQIKSKEKHALPIIITHGWPGSVIEQLKLIEPLTNPTQHGGSASDAFDVVIPSIPGYGFSGKPTTTGWDPGRVASAWTVLMKRLGYHRFVAQGGDIGAVITTRMGEQAAPELVGIHTNFPAVTPPEIARALGGPVPAGLSADERRMFEQLQAFRGMHGAYAAMMTTRPQTLYGLTDSPIALAAWILDHGDGYDQPAAAITSAISGRTVDGHTSGAVTRDDVLDDITLYWLTNTGISAARLYWESKGTALNAADVSVPTAVTIFPGEIYQAPKSWTERAYHKLIYYNVVDKGGHFAAWEQPELFASELRAAFRPLR